MIADTVAATSHSYDTYWIRTLYQYVKPRFKKNSRLLLPLYPALYPNNAFLEAAFERFRWVSLNEPDAERLSGLEEDLRDRLNACKNTPLNAMPFEDNRFDVILLAQAQEPVLSTQLTETFETLFRLTKPGGQVILSFPMNRNLLVNTIETLLLPESKTPRHLLTLGVPQILWTLRAAGFEQATFEPFGHLGYWFLRAYDAMTQQSDKIPDWLLQACIRFDERSRHLPFWNRLCWLGIVTCFKPA